MKSNHTRTSKCVRLWSDQKIKQLEALGGEGAQAQCPIAGDANGIPSFTRAGRQFRESICCMRQPWPVWFVQTILRSSGTGSRVWPHIIWPPSAPADRLPSWHAPPVLSFLAGSAVPCSSSGWILPVSWYLDYCWCHTTCTPFPSLAPALPFKEFAIYWSYTRSILKRSYNFAHVWHEDLMSIYSSNDLAIACLSIWTNAAPTRTTQVTTKESGLASDMSLKQLRGSLFVSRRRAKCGKWLSTLSRSNGASTIEIPGNWQYSAWRWTVVTIWSSKASVVPGSPRNRRWP